MVSVPSGTRFFFSLFPRALHEAIADQADHVLAQNARAIARDPFQRETQQDRQRHARAQQEQLTRLNVAFGQQVDYVALELQRHRGKRGDGDRQEDQDDLAFFR
ncbi:hypothetical protein ACFOHS_09120 [Jhaorihella thermophila]